MLSDYPQTRAQHQQQHYIHQQQQQGMASEASASLPRLSNITNPLAIHPLSTPPAATRKPIPSHHPHLQQQQQQQQRLPSIGSVGANMVLEEDLTAAATMLRPPVAMQQSSLMHPTTTTTAAGVMSYVDSRMQEATCVSRPGSSKSNTPAADTFSGKKPHAGNTRF